MRRTGNVHAEPAVKEYGQVRGLSHEHWLRGGGTPGFVCGEQWSMSQEHWSYYAAEPEGDEKLVLV